MALSCISHRYALINDHAAEPVIRSEFLRVERIHTNREIAQTIPVAFINRFLLGDMLLQILCAEAFRGLLYDQRSVRVAYLFKLIHFPCVP